MKRGKKMTLILVVAMVMTVAMVVMAYAEYLYAPAWNDGTGRYTQVYEMSVGTNWRYTSEIYPQYGIDEDTSCYVYKMFPERDCLVQCTYNGLTTYPTYYKVYTADAFPLTTEASITGTGTTAIDFPYASNAGNAMCMGIRHDPRDNSNITNRGNWSPDTY